MAKIEIINKGITSDEFKILARVSKDPFLFATNIFVIHPVQGRVQFNLYEYQQLVLYHFLKNRFNIVLKFRQAGLTELISLYCLWLAMFHDNKNIQIISIKDRVAKKVLRRIKYMYRNLPEFLKIKVVNGRPSEIGTAQEAEFSNGSIITSIPTTEDAGRSEAVSLLVIDEAAIVRWATQIWAAAFPTLSCAVYETPIFIRRISKIKKVYKKKITEIKQLGTICPDTKGIIDISHLELKTLTHTGEWKNIIYVQNKGKLETWYVKDCKSKINGFAPAHKLYTTKGWKTVKEIINHNLNIISVDTGIDNLQEKPVTIPPRNEITKSINGFPNYFISNLGNIYKNKNGSLVKLLPRPNKDGYLRIGLTNGTKRNSGNFNNTRKNKTFQLPIAKLVVQAFIGDKPKGYQIDHIDCDRTHNYSTNLRIVLSGSVNVKRSYKYNLNAQLSTISYDKLPDLDIRGKILEMYQEGYSYLDIAKIVYPYKLQGHKFIKRIIKERNSRVYISKLTLIKKSLKTIYDFQVEGDHSYISANNYINHNTGGSAILNSTPFGIGNFYHKQWVDAVAGGNEFFPIRLFWRMHPERDDEWYRIMSGALGARRTAQEIDGDFLTSGNSVFDLTDIKAIEDGLTEIEICEERLNGNLIIVKQPIPGEKYFIGADIATGRSTDYSAFSVMNREGEEYAYFKGKIAVGQFANLLMEIGKMYFYALLAPESNDIGLAVTIKIQESGYPNLFYTTKFLKEKGESKPKKSKLPGWYTDRKTRPIIIDELEEDIRNDFVIINNRFFVQEAYTFIYDERNRPVAMGKHSRGTNEEDLLDDENTYTDDSIIAEAITNFIRKGKITTVVVVPR